LRTLLDRYGFLAETGRLQSESDAVIRSDCAGCSIGNVPGTGTGIRPLTIADISGQRPPARLEIQ